MGRGGVRVRAKRHRLLSIGLLVPHEGHRRGAGPGLLRDVSGPGVDVEPRPGDRRLQRPSSGDKRHGGVMTIPARISIVTLGVADLDRSVRFYTALGWERCSSSNDEIGWFRTADTNLGLFPF